MSVDYTHACERAELLDLPIPSEEEFAENQRAEEATRVDEDAVDDAALQNLDHAVESAQRMSGGLDELNNILSATQKKLTRLKTVCGSLGTILKVRIGSRTSTPNHKANPEENLEDVKAADATEKSTTVLEETLAVEIPENEADAKGVEPEANANPSAPRKIDLNEKMSSHLGKLDSLITKAESAQYSMQHQNKQMRNFLK